MRHWFVLVLLVCCTSGSAQERSPQFFVLAGAARASGDEGSLGAGWLAGGAVTVPFTQRWALDVVVDHLRSRRDIAGGSLAGRHTHFSPGIQYRRGQGRAYGYVAGGPGVTINSGSEGSSGLQWHVRGGVVSRLTGRLLLRAEVFSSFRFVQPDAGVRAGIGYQFGTRD